MAKSKKPLNKDQRSCVVDHWENPDDTETGAERLKQCKEKKTQNVAVQKQREKESVTPADSESSMPSSKEPESSTAESKVNNNTLSDGSGKDSSAYEPDMIQEEEASSEGEVENKDADSHVTTVTAKKTNAKGKKNKTMVQSSIVSLRATNNTTGTPSVKCKAENDGYKSITVADSKKPSKKQKSGVAAQAREVGPENDFLVQPGGLVGKDEDPHIEYLDIIKAGPSDGMSIIKITVKEKITATARKACSGKPKWQQMHLPKEMGLLFTTKLIPYAHKHLLRAMANPWVPLTIQEIQNAVDTVVGKDQFEVASKDMCYSFAVMAVKCTEKFFKDYSNELSSPELRAEFIKWFVIPSGKACTAPFMWETWGNGSDASGLFHHLLIVDTLAQAHFSNIIVISDSKKTQPVSFEEQAKQGNSTKMKTIKIKHVMQWLKMLNTWMDAKWEALLVDVKKVVEESIPKKHHGGSGHSLSPIKIIKEDSDDEFWHLTLLMCLKWGK
ncbi:hypothetical protein ARMGADRAFT_1039558 [Armillaria gallica]|uniref:Uncharacterized protein n=1 Tax=Armillaria gallica TaxID=47427 RepID=A0A2H3CD89_ARMGA|nr:hypothetical protein ARMGADRAFT_1039558 [Armillaria gallica]